MNIFSKIMKKMARQVQKTCSIRYQTFGSTGKVKYKPSLIYKNMYMYVHFCRFTLGCFQKRSNTSGTIHEICKKEFCIFHIVLEWFVWKTILIHWEKWSLWFAWLVRKVFCKCLFNKHFIGKDTVWYFTCFSLFLEKYIFDFYNQLLDKILLVILGVFIFGGILGFLFGITLTRKRFVLLVHLLDRLFIKSELILSFLPSNMSQFLHPYIYNSSLSIPNVFLNWNSIFHLRILLACMSCKSKSL